MVGKRIISALTCAAMAVSMTTVFSGCSLKEFFNNEKPVTDSSDDVITNGEWLAMINDAFGMQVDENSESGEIDAAKEWGVIGENDVIDENAPVSDQFATSTLMRATGFVGRDASNEEIIKSAIDHGVIQSSDSTFSDPAQAITALSEAQNAWSHQVFENKADIQLADNVVNLSETISAGDVKIDEGNVTIPSNYAENLQKDEIYIVPKEAGDNKGGAYKVIAVVDHGNGTSTVKSVPATFEEVYQKVNVSGQFTPNINDIEIVDSRAKMSNVIDGVSHNTGEGSIKPLSCVNDANIVPMGTVGLADTNFEVDLDDFKINFSLKDVALNANIDWDYGIFKGLEINQIYMGIDYTTEMAVTSSFLKGEASIEAAIAKKALSEPSIEIAKMAIYICPGLSVNFRVKVSLELNGEIKVSVSTENTKGFELVGSSLRAINETSTTADFSISGDIGLYGILTVALSLDYIVGEVDLLSLELKVGPKMEASITAHTSVNKEDEMLCVDVSGYLDIDLKLKLLSGILDFLGLEASITLLDLDYDTSPKKWTKIHLENFERTAGDVCTWNKETTAAATTTTIPTGIFAFNKTYLSMNEGEASQITFKSLPSGYTASDIEWSSSDTAKATVDSNGNVKAITAGSVSITAKTKDGKYTSSCAVTVKSVSSSVVGRVINSDDKMEFAAA